LVIGSGLGVDFDEWFLSVVALLDVVCFFLLPLSIYITVKGYSESEKKACLPSYCYWRHWRRILYYIRPPLIVYRLLMVQINRLLTKLKVCSSINNMKLVFITSPTPELTQNFL
jgi:hypothetical protein